MAAPVENPMVSLVSGPSGQTMDDNTYAPPSNGQTPKDAEKFEEIVDPNQWWIDRKLKALGRKLEKGCEDGSAGIAIMAGFMAGISVAVGIVWTLELGGFAAVTLLSGPVGCGLVAVVFLLVALAVLARRHQALTAEGKDPHTAKALLLTAGAPVAGVAFIPAMAITAGVGIVAGLIGALFISCCTGDDDE